MRWLLTTWLVGFLCGWALAAGIDDRKPARVPENPQLRADSQNYAQQLIYTIDQVATQYVRPVARKDLLVAALRGLHEAARVPLPGRVEADVARVEENREELLALLVQLREGLGDVEPLRRNEALLASCRGLLRLLDTHSALVSGEELRRSSGVDRQRGVGIEISDGTVGPIRVHTVLPGSPAQRAGIRPGDEITHVDDKPLQGDTPAQAAVRLNLGTPSEVQQVLHEDRVELVRVTLRRPGEASRTLMLERLELQPEIVLGVRRLDDNSWDHFLDPTSGIVHLRLGKLGNGAALELRRTLEKLQGEGMRGVLLDLRWCPGGYLRESVNCAALFLGQCTVATVRTREEGEKPFTSDRADGKFLDLPLVVLVNGQTSGGAELIAAAIQDNKRAPIAGQRTIGKGSIQTVVTIAGEAGLKLTSGTFVRASGKNLHRFPESGVRDDWGVLPDRDLECRASPELARQLQSWWEQQTLRPGGSRQALPLDDPAADPQRQTALHALRRLLESKRASRGPVVP